MWKYWLHYYESQLLCKRCFFSGIAESSLLRQSKVQKFSQYIEVENEDSCSVANPFIKNGIFGNTAVASFFSLTLFSWSHKTEVDPKSPPWGSFPLMPEISSSMCKRNSWKRKKNMRKLATLGRFVKVPWKMVFLIQQQFPEVHRCIAEKSFPRASKCFRKPSSLYGKCIFAIKRRSNAHFFQYVLQLMLEKFFPID